MNAFDQMRDAIAQAQQIERAANSNAGVMAGLIAGKLQSGNIDPAVLRKLKDELRRFNTHTEKWRPIK